MLRTIRTMRARFGNDMAGSLGTFGMIFVALPSSEGLGTIYHFVTPEVLILDQVLFALTYYITLSLNCLLTYKILKVRYLS